jgi:hypothetical protein
MFFLYFVEKLRLVKEEAGVIKEKRTINTIAALLR